MKETVARLGESDTRVWYRVLSSFVSFAGVRAPTTPRESAAAVAALAGQRHWGSRAYGTTLATLRHHIVEGAHDGIIASVAHVLAADVGAAYLRCRPSVCDYEKDAAGWAVLNELWRGHWERRRA